MRLKLSDALKLSWGNVAQHKKRSLIIVLTISLLFGVIMGFNFITTSVEETVISASAGQTNGDVYVEARYENSNGMRVDKTIDTPEELSEISLEPVTDEAVEQKIRERAKIYNGEVVGYYYYYQLDQPYRVITKSAVAQFIDEELWSKLPDDRMPAIMPEGWKPQTFMGDSNFHNRIGDSLCRVGSIPGTEVGHPTLDGFNPLNVVLAQLPHAPNDDDFWLVDDGSGKVEAYIKAQLEAYLSEDGGWYNVVPIQKIDVLKFSDPYQAAAYMSPDEEMLGVKLYSDFKYRAQDLFGTTLWVASSFNTQRLLLIAVEALLLVVATLVAVITFAHLIDQDAATVALYHSMGASTGNIYLIYFLYLMELCLLAVAASILIAFAFIGLLTITSVGALAERLQTFYNLNYLPSVALFKLNGGFWTVVVTILLIAPISMLLTLRHFSAKNIARKMKED